MMRHLVVSAFVITTTTFACSMSDPAGEQEGATLDRAAESASLVQGAGGELLGGAYDDGTVGAANVSKILVFGDYSEAINSVTSKLRGLEHSVTVMAALPLTIEDLRSYNTIWHVGIIRQLHPYEQDLLIEYVSAGGGLHLGGERITSDSMNDSLGVVVNALVAGGGIQVGRFGSDVSPARGLSFNGYYDINLNVLDGALFDATHSPTDVQMAGVGRLGGVAPRNVLLTGASNLPVGAIWDSGDLVQGAGTLSIVMDSNWLTLSHNGNPLFLDKMVGFHKGAPNHPPVADAGGQRPPYNCAPAGSTMRIVLDGTGSDDPDGDILTFTWTMNGQNIGTGSTPSIDLGPGVHTITLTVSDGRLQDSDTVVIEVLECRENCSPDRPFWTYCTPECPCDHGEGDCDVDEDCLPGLICLHDPGPDFGYLDPEADVCSHNCPTLGVGAWNYCSEECPCAAGEGDCDSDSECEPGLVCARDVGPAYGWDPETDVCEPPSGT